MRIKRIEKRVERMKSLEWLKVPDEDEEKEKKKKKEAEARKAKEKGKEDKDKLKRRALLGGVLEMGVSRGKRPPFKASEAQKPRLNPVASKWHPFDDEV